MKCLINKKVIGITEHSRKMFQVHIDNLRHTENYELCRISKPSYPREIKQSCYGYLKML